MSTLRHYVQVLGRRKWLVLVPLVLLPVVVLVLTLRQGAFYEASADVFVNRQEAATTSVIGETPALDNADRTMQTQVRLARVPTVLERALAVAEETDISRSVLLSNSSVLPQADILRFSVTRPEREDAARLANAYANAFVDYRRELETAGLARTLGELQERLADLEAAGRQGSQLYATLADREQQLESLVALRESNVSVVRTDEAADADQVAPRPRRNVALAAAAGAVIGLILAFLAETLGTRPRSEDEFEALLGMPLLARLTLPVEPADGSDRETRRTDQLHTLRTGLELENAQAGARTIMLTGSSVGDEKSVVATELAAVLARTGRHVTLVDLDLRSRHLSRLLGLEGGIGIASLARGQCELADALEPVALERSEPPARAASNGRGQLSRLDAVGAGPAVADPAEVLSSPRVAEALTELERRSELTFVDVASVLDFPDGAIVAPAVDGLVVIVTEREAHAPALIALRRTIDAWPLARLGFVLIEGGSSRGHLGAFRHVKRWTSRPAAERERVA